jgi:apolipoprotein N-acyltransferase
VPPPPSGSPSEPDTSPADPSSPPQRARAPGATGTPDPASGDPPLAGQPAPARTTRRRAARGFAAGWAFGTGYFALALVWILQPFFVDPVRHGWMAPFALLFLAAGLALFWGAALALAACTRHPLAAAVPALALAELARAYVFTGFPWASIGHAWIGWPPVHLAAWGGAGLLGLAVLVPAALAARLRPAPVAAAAMLVAATVALGQWRQSRPLPPDTPHVVRIVQPAIAQSLKWDQATAGQTWTTLLSLTAAPGSPALTVWPETALPWLFDGPGGSIAEAASGRPVLVGAIRVEGSRVYNALLSVGPAGRLSGIYDKHHPVPFGEYIPFEPVLSLLGLRAFTAREGYGFTAGPGPRLLDLGPLGQALPLICYEAIFPQDLRGTARPDWLVNVTNDAWFGTFSGPYQHLAQARLRAVEQGLPMVRAANTGVSALIDPHGVLRGQLPLGTRGTLDLPLPAPLPQTLYARSGDLPLAALLSLLLLALLRTARRPQSG